MKNIFKFLFIAFIFSSSLVFAQHPVRPEKSSESWRLLSSAYASYEAGDYSKAIAMAEEAKLSRNREKNWNDYLLKNALSSYEVRKAGDAITDILPVLTEREEYEVVALIQSFLNRYGLDYFDNSISKLHKFVLKLENYPEADFILAKIYRLEGEYSLVMEYLEKARKASEVLDVQEQSFDILYEMAEVSEITGDSDTYEKTLLLIIGNDGYYKDDTLRKAILRTIKTERKDNVSHFFMLYRIDAPRQINAYLKLAKLYSDKGRLQDSLVMNSYGVVSSFTHMLSILQQRNPEYSFVSMDDFFEECLRWPDVIYWAQKNQVWEGFYELAVRSRSTGNIYFSDLLLKLESEVLPDPYWKACALEFKKNSKADQ